MAANSVSDLIRICLNGIYSGSVCMCVYVCVCVRARVCVLQQTHGSCLSYRDNNMFPSMSIYYRCQFDVTLHGGGGGGIEPKLILANWNVMFQLTSFLLRFLILHNSEAVLIVHLDSTSCRRHASALSVFVGYFIHR